MFVDRSLAYGLQHYLGLITFSSAPRVVQQLTNVDEDFRHSLTKVKCTGHTSLWDALWKAHCDILDCAAIHPDARKRIICLSDGEDTNSTFHTAQEVCLALQVLNLTKFAHVGIAEQYRARYNYDRPRR